MIGRRGTKMLSGIGLAIWFSSGCGKPVPTPLAPVRGFVTYQGRPLAGGLIVFTPDPSTPTRTLFAARLDADGRYELAPAPPVVPGAPLGASQGVPTGWYSVAFADAPHTGFSRFPQELKRPDQSGVRREVLVGRDNVLDFHISASD